MKNAELIAEITKSRKTKEVCYVSTIFKQTVIMDAAEDLEVSDNDHSISCQANIPSFTFEAFIEVLIELRKSFDVGCAYSKEPISHEYFSINNVVGDKDYKFAYRDSICDNVSC